MTKSHVSLGQYQCPVCGVTHDSGEVLLDRRMRQVLEEKTVTGWKMCEAHQKMKDGGYVALVEVDSDQRAMTGRIAHMRESVWPNWFTTPVPPAGIAHCNKETMDLLAHIAGPDDEIH